MKNLILTMAVLLYLLTMAALMGQVDRVILEHRNLEHAAEEAAIAAVLTGIPGNRIDEIHLDSAVCEAAAWRAVRRNIVSKNPEMELEQEEQVHPTVRVRLREGRVRAEVAYELVRTKEGWRARRVPSADL